MSKGSAGLMPVKHHMTQIEVITYLGRQVFMDAVEHKWLQPAVRRGQGTVFYASRSVEQVSRRVAEGEYPGQELVKA